MSNRKFCNPISEFQPARFEQARISRGFNKTELAKVLGVSQQMVSKYESGKSIPSEPVFRLLTEELHFPLGFFFKPIIENTRNKTIFWRKQSAATLKQKDARAVRNEWVEEIIDYLAKIVRFPDANLPNISKKPKGVSWTPEEIEQLALKVRQHWGLGLGPISNIVMLLEKNGIIVCFQKTNFNTIDGYSYKDKLPLVFLVSNSKSAVRSRFSAAHELGHLIMHSGIYENDDLIFNSIYNQVEAEANHFASAFLMPIDSFGQEVYSSSLSHLKLLKSRWLVSMQAMITRCGDLEILTEHQVLYLRKQISKFKIRIHEPLDDEIPMEEPVLLKQAIEMLIEHKVKTPSMIINELNLPTEDIEEICNLDNNRLSSQDNIVYVNFRSKN
jgi:Zn-dependent peptidase ImmA (M78 family)/transcriptional regulator with XRE-family HTH domain